MDLFCSFYFSRFSSYFCIFLFSQMSRRSQKLVFFVICLEISSMSGFFCACITYFCSSCPFFTSRVLESLYRWSKTLIDLRYRGATWVSSMVKLSTFTDLLIFLWLLLMLGVNLHQLNYLFYDYSMILLMDSSFFFFIFCSSCSLLILVMISFDMGLILGRCWHYFTSCSYFYFCFRLIHSFLAFSSMTALSYRLQSRLLLLVQMVEQLPWSMGSYCDIQVLSLCFLPGGRGGGCVGLLIALSASFRIYYQKLVKELGEALMILLRLRELSSGYSQER